jgi:outer membrane receptor protein involved in Fe transport
VKKLLWILLFFLLIPTAVFAQGNGFVTGIIVDKATAEPLIEAGIEVVGAGKKTFTDIDGKYRLELPEGTYEVRAFYPQYQGQRIQNVVVKAGKGTQLDLTLSQKAEQEIEVVEVVVEPDRASEATQLLIRKKAAAVTDNVSAEVIAKQPDSDVAAIVERAPGVTVVDDKFVYIRGLGERYTSSSLNDTALPSTQTEKKVVPLDLFSADVLESVNVIKSYTPDLPGEFTAGLVQITTKDYPEAFEMKLSASVKYNSETTGEDIETYDGGDTDWLGFDDGTRELPDEVPGKKVLGLPPEEQAKIGRSFPNIWNTETETAPPSYGGNFHVGNKYSKFGFVFDLTYDADYQRKEEKYYVYTPPESGMQVRKNLDFTYSEETYNWSGILNMGYELSPTDKISFKNLYTRKAQDQVRTFGGYFHENRVEEVNEENTRGTRLYWTEEGIYSGQLTGDHYFKGLPLLTSNQEISSTITWRLGYGKSTLDEPDLREYLYVLNQNTLEFEFYPSGSSGLRTFTEIDEDMYDSGFDWELDLTPLIRHPLKAKFGPAYSFRDRDFEHRRFNYFGSYAGIDRTQDLESILSPENIRPGRIALEESTRFTDSYEADHQIIAGYIMADTSQFFFKNLRFIGGLRVEDSEQTLEGADPEVTTEFKPLTVENKETDFFPSASLIYGMTKDMNLRLNFSKTVNRPEFREIAPYLFTDFSAGVDTVGNPDLERALIMSYDLRWEWFLSSEELLSVSVFYKDIEDPIERIRFPTANDNYQSSFQNSEKAENYGFEIEVRKNLGFIHAFFSPFSLFTNYTYVDSEVTIKDEGFRTYSLTSKKRPLQGQSDHAGNIILEYNLKKSDLIVRLLYNYVGERISDVGVGGRDDIIEEASNWLDIILIKRFGNWGVKLAAKNLLDEEILYTQGGKTQQRYKEGISVGFSISYGI